jgi:hypothetical protein
LDSCFHSKASRASRPYPETALSVLKFEFASTRIPEVHEATHFNLDHLPTQWPNICLGKCNPESVKLLSKQENAAARLLMVLMWCNILQHTAAGYFFKYTGKVAADILFRFSNAPELYLCWVSNMKRPSKTLLSHIKFVNNGAFFTVNKLGMVGWISYREGIARSQDVIGELPTFKFQLVTDPVVGNTWSSGATWY